MMKSTLCSVLYYAFYLPVGTDDYMDYFEIDRTTGKVSQIAPLNRLLHREFRLLVQANEDQGKQRFETADLVISVESANDFEPELSSSLGVFIGYVTENSPQNTFVKDQQLIDPLRIIASDPDQVRKWRERELGERELREREREREIER